MADDGNKADGDKAAERKNAPIKPEEVKVTVKPRQPGEMPPKRDADARRQAEERNARAKELADKATDGATKEIREAVKQAAPGGRQAQKEAAEKAAEKVGEKLPQRIIKEVQVDLPGEKPIVKPATEGPPAPQPPDKKQALKRGI